MIGCIDYIQLCFQNHWSTRIFTTSGHNKHISDQTLHFYLTQNNYHPSFCSSYFLCFSLVDDSYHFIYFWCICIMDHLLNFSLFTSTVIHQASIRVRHFYGYTGGEIPYLFESASIQNIFKPALPPTLLFFQISGAVDQIDSAQER